MNRSANGAAAGYDEQRKVMAVEGTIPADAQKAELELRGDMLGMAADKVPPIANVFDFALTEKVNAELAASGWTPKP